MMEGANLAQQQAVGILGVNLIYAAFFRGETTEGFLAGLFDDLAHGRIEVDLAAFRGPEFDTLDPRLPLAELAPVQRQVGAACAPRHEAVAASREP